MIILALDPSTAVTGAVVLLYDEHGNRHLIGRHAIDATKIGGSDSDMTSRIRRILWTAEHLSAWLDRCPCPVDLVAYEVDSQRGFNSSEALKMAAGHYLATVFAALLRRYQTRKITVVPITRQAACIVAGCYGIYRSPKGKTAKEQQAKRDRLKAAVIEWANGEFSNIVLGPEEDAVADALAIGQAAYNGHQVKRRALAEKEAQKALFGRGSGTRKKPVKKDMAA